MIHADKGSVKVEGTIGEILMDISTICGALGGEFGQDEVVKAVAMGLAVLPGKANRIDLSELHNVLEHLKDDSEE